MRNWHWWRWSSPREDEGKNEQALIAREQAEATLEKAKAQVSESKGLADTLAAIRADNHFRQMFNDALGNKGT